jgi:Transglycosylase SLT domain
LPQHRSATLEAARPAPDSERTPSSASREPRGARKNARKKRGPRRRIGIIPSALGIGAVLVSIVYLASYMTTANDSGAASMFGAIDGLGQSGSVAALAQERTTIIEMNAAAKTLTPASKSVTANPAMLQQQIAESEETGGTGITAVPPPADPTAAQLDAKNMLASYGWDNTTQWTCLYNLWERESTWNVYADNTSSGAYGIPQSDPGDKMAMFGSDWQTDPVTQIKWGLYYINTTYGTPCNAWQSEITYNAY